jgi:HEAT repeat protein
MKNVLNVSLICLGLLLVSAYVPAESFEQAQERKERKASTAQTVLSASEKAAMLKNAEEREKRGLAAYVPKQLALLEKAIRDKKSLYPPNSEDYTILELARVKEKRAVPLLAQILKDYPVGMARADAADALAEIGDRSAIPALLSALEGNDIRVKTKVAIALVKFGETEAALPILIKIANKDYAAHWDIDVERDLWGRKDEGLYKTELIKKFKTEILPYQALTTLSRLNNFETTTVIENALNDHNPFIRVHAACLLSEKGKWDISLPILKQIATDETLNELTRESAIRMMAKKGDSEVRKLLQDLSSDRNEYIGNKARKILSELGKNK